MKRYKVHYADLDGVAGYMNIPARSKREAVKYLSDILEGFTLIYRIEEE